MSATQERVLEIRNAQGDVLFSVHTGAQRELPREKKNSGSEKRAPAAKNEDGEDLMTDAQKRFLFRLMADRGVEGEEAHEELKKAFSVDSLKEVTKAQASKEIERLLDSAKGGGDE
jgi:hypothetical protein